MSRENSDLVIMGKKDPFIRKLWHAHYAMAEAIKDLEDASNDTRFLRYENLHPYQKDLLDLLGEFSHEIFSIPGNKIFTTAVQQDWLEFLEMILNDYKAKVQNSVNIINKIEKSLLKKNTFKEIRAEISEILSPYYFSPKSVLQLTYKIKELNSKKITAKDFKVRIKHIIENEIDFTSLIKKRCEHAFRATETFDESDPSYPTLAHPSYLILDLDAFVKNAWDYRNSSRTDQGPKQEAKNILSKIFQGSSSTSTRDILKEDYTKKYPIYFHCENYPKRNEVLSRLADEFGFKITNDLKSFETHEKIFNRPDVPASRRYNEFLKLNPKQKKINDN